MGVAAVGAGLVWLVVLSVYDVRTRRLPNWLTLPGALIIFLVATLFGFGPAALAGAAVLTALYLPVHLIAPRAMGGGDVKLAVGLGALTGVFGADVWVLAALGAPVLTALVAGVAVWRGIATVPHGPAMCVASAAAIGLAMI